MAGKRGPGGPELYTPEIADEICERLADGESLRAICKSSNVNGKLTERTCEPWFPAASTVCKWVEHNTHGIGERYARVRVLGYDQMAQQALEIADKASPDDANVARLRLDARKWFLSKVDPVRYGEKVQLTGDGGGPIETHELTDTERNHRIAALLEAGRASRTGQAADGRAADLDAPGGSADGGPGEQG